MSDVYLETERVRLRQYRDADFGIFLEMNSDPEVMRHLTGGRASTRAEVADGVARAKLYREKYAGRLGVFTAELSATGEVMGWFLLRPDRNDLENTRDLELGYRLKKEFWGAGYATEVARALVAKAFAELGAASVWAQALASNAASRRVMEKCGLRFEAESADHGHEAPGPGVRYRLRRAA